MPSATFGLHAVYHGDDAPLLSPRKHKMSRGRGQRNEPVDYDMPDALAAVSQGVTTIVAASLSDQLSLTTSSMT